MVGDNNSATRTPTASDEKCFKNPLLAISHRSLDLQTHSLLQINFTFAEVVGIT
jgi:hypothetical protein